MHTNSLEAYSTVDLTKGERSAVELLAKYGPASQAELIQACCANEPSFQAMEDAQRVKAGQNLYARLHGLKKQGYAIIVGTKPDPWTDNTVDIYALNPNPSAVPATPKLPSAKVLLERIRGLEDAMGMYGTQAVAANSVITMLKGIYAP